MTGEPQVSPRPLAAAGAPGPGRRRWLVLAVIAVAQLMVVLDATIVNIALPSAQQALGFSVTDRQWVVTAYALAFGGLLLVGGRLSDLLGRKRTFIAGLAGFAAASALGGAAPGFGILVAARAVQGSFAALLAPSALALLITTFTDPRERGKALGIYTAIAGGGGAVGLLLGGVLTEYLSWRWCLYVNVAFAAVALAGAATLITSQARSAGARLDVPGSILAAGGLAAIVYGFSAASTDGWGSGLTIGFIAGGVVLLGAFVLVERWVRHPLVPLAILTDRIRGAAYLGAVIAGIGIIGLFLLLTYYLQGVLGFTPLQAGLAFLPFIGGITVAANIVSNGGLARLGPKVIVPAGLILAAAGAAWLTRIGVHGSYGLDVAPALVLVGFGVSCAVVSAFTLGPAGARPGRHRGGGRAGEQQQPGRRLAGRGPAQHDRGRFRRRVPGSARAALPAPRPPPCTATSPRSPSSRCCSPPGPCSPACCTPAGPWSPPGRRRCPAWSRRPLTAFRR